MSIFNYKPIMYADKFMSIKYHHRMKYKLFLLDLDDTLLDFQASEKLCFKETMDKFGFIKSLEDLHKTYKIENNLLWKQVESGEIDKDFLKVERFKRTLEHHKIELPPHLMADYYLDQLPKNVVLIDGAVEALKYLKQFGEIGIITNGIQSTQKQRIENSALQDYIDFIAVSDECGYAKPDVRFFEFTVKKAKLFSKETTIVIGDRIEADILGGNNFGIDTCWFNPKKLESQNGIQPTFIINSLNEIQNLL